MARLEQGSFRRCFIIRWHSESEGVTAIAEETPDPEPLPGSQACSRPSGLILDVEGRDGRLQSDNGLVGRFVSPTTIAVRGIATYLAPSGHVVRVRGTEIFQRI
jgi:hypothetical protein